jgi:hypothetical protein
MREMRNVHDILVEILKGRDYLEGLGVDGKTVLEYTLKKFGAKCRLNSLA